MHRPSARESWAWRPSTAVSMSARWGSLACGATKRPRACCSCPCGRPRRPARLGWTTGGCRRLAPLATTNAWSTSVLTKVTSSLGRPCRRWETFMSGVAWPWQWHGIGSTETWPLPMSRSLSLLSDSICGVWTEEATWQTLQLYRRAEKIGIGYERTRAENWRRQFPVAVGNSPPRDWNETARIRPWLIIQRIALILISILAVQIWRFQTRSVVVDESDVFGFVRIYNILRFKNFIKKD